MGIRCPTRPPNFNFPSWSDQELVPFGPVFFGSIRCSFRWASVLPCSRPPNVNFPFWSDQKLVILELGRFYWVRSYVRWDRYPFLHSSAKFQLRRLIPSVMTDARWLRLSHTSSQVSKTSKLVQSLAANGVQDKTFDPSPQKLLFGFEWTSNLLNAMLDKPWKLCIQELSGF
jgi:hypothetical protein